MDTVTKHSLIIAVVLAAIITVSVKNNTECDYEANKNNVSSETSSIIVETNQNVNSGIPLGDRLEDDKIKPMTEQEETQEEVRETTKKKQPYKYENMSVPKNNGIKSYMDYRCITLKSSKQYKLQKSLAYTGDHGIRMVGDRYCVAVGSYYTTTIGQYIDIELENGNVIRGILADCKDNKHTDETNRINPNGSVVEFVVDIRDLDKTAKKTGDISYVNGWNSKIVNIRVYDKIEEF